MKYKRLVVAIIVAILMVVIMFLTFQYCRPLYMIIIGYCGGTYIGSKLCKLIDWIFVKENESKEK
jgi:hypothetical protein